MESCTATTSVRPFAPFVHGMSRGRTVIIRRRRRTPRMCLLLPLNVPLLINRSYRRSRNCSGVESAPSPFAFELNTIFYSARLNQLTPSSVIERDPLSGLMTSLTPGRVLQYLPRVAPQELESAVSKWGVELPLIVCPLAAELVVALHHNHRPPSIHHQVQSHFGGYLMCKLIEMKTNQVTCLNFNHSGRREEKWRREKTSACC